MRAARSALAIRDESGRTGRDARAVESVGCAAAAIGAITPGLRVFLLTRGQFSLLDMVLHVGPQQFEAKRLRRAARPIAAGVTGEVT